MKKYIPVVMFKLHILTGFKFPFYRNTIFYPSSIQSMSQPLALEQAGLRTSVYSPNHVTRSEVTKTRTASIEGTPDLKQRPLPNEVVGKGQNKSGGKFGKDRKGRRMRGSALWGGNDFEIEARQKKNEDEEEARETATGEEEERESANEYVADWYNHTQMDKPLAEREGFKNAKDVFVFEQLEQGPTHRRSTRLTHAKSTLQPAQKTSSASKRSAAKDDSILVKVSLHDFNTNFVGR